MLFLSTPGLCSETAFSSFQVCQCINFHKAWSRVWRCWDLSNMGFALLSCGTWLYTTSFGGLVKTCYIFTVPQLPMMILVIGADKLYQQYLLMFWYRLHRKHLRLFPRPYRSCVCLACVAGAVKKEPRVILFSLTVAVQFVPFITVQQHFRKVHVQPGS